jgi:hypothetical protein
MLAWDPPGGTLALPPTDKWDEDGGPNDYYYYESDGE